MAGARLTQRELRCIHGLARCMLPEGFDVPGGDKAGVAARMQEQTAYLNPAVARRLAWIVRLWDWSPLLSRHRARFGDLDPAIQDEWVERGYRSRAVLRRLHVAALKQFIFLAWASGSAARPTTVGWAYQPLIG